MKLNVYLQSLVERANLNLKLVGMTAMLGTSLILTGCNEKTIVQETSVLEENEADLETTTIEEQKLSMDGVETEENENFMPFARKDGNIAKFLVIKLNENMAFKFGYFEANDDCSALIFKEAFTGNMINLSYIKEVASDSTFYVDDAANLFGVDQLLSGGISKDEVNKFNSVELETVVNLGIYVNIVDEFGEKIYNDDIYVKYFLPDSIIEEYSPSSKVK